jgi:hypothetical protein
MVRRSFCSLSFRPNSIYCLEKASLTNKHDTLPWSELRVEVRPGLVTSASSSIPTSQTFCSPAVPLPSPMSAHRYPRMLSWMPLPSQVESKRSATFSSTLSSTLDAFQSLSADMAAAAGIGALLTKSWAGDQALTLRVDGKGEKELFRCVCPGRVHYQFC